MNVFEYLITVMDNFGRYLEQMKKTSKNKEEATWYQSRIKFLQRFREREIYPLRRFLQNELDKEFLDMKVKENLDNFEKMGKNQDLMKRFEE